ncbi:MAG: M35 family metallo-endopeptidase [Polyangiales bacterium]
MKSVKGNFCCTVYVGVLLAVGGATGAAKAQIYSVQNCSSGQKTLVKAAVVAAIGYLNASHADSKVQRWFGAQKGTQGWTDTINDIAYFKSYAGMLINRDVGGAFDPQAVTFDCSGGRSSLVAHNKGAGTGTIYLDDLFWGLPVKSSYCCKNSQAGAIIHEMSHLMGTLDASVVWNLGVVDEFQLALDIASQDGPYTAVWNANNWEYFFQNL